MPITEHVLVCTRGKFHIIKAKTHKRVAYGRSWKLTRRGLWCTWGSVRLATRAHRAVSQIRQRASVLSLSAEQTQKTWVFSLQATVQCSKFSAALLTFELFGLSSVRNNITDVCKSSLVPEVGRTCISDSSMHVLDNGSALNFKCNNSHVELQSYHMHIFWYILFNMCM